jgi:osmotically-inducible protein OsmY
MNRIIRRLALAGSIALALHGISTAFADDLIPLGTMNEKISDARRESLILSGFNMNSHLQAFTFAVVVDGNSAVLDGSVGDSAARDLAEQIAMTVEGIRHVDNRISVDASTHPADAAQTIETEGRKGG